MSTAMALCNWGIDATAQRSTVIMTALLGLTLSSFEVCCKHASAQAVSQLIDPYTMELIQCNVLFRRCTEVARQSITVGIMAVTLLVNQQVIPLLRLLHSESITSWNESKSGPCWWWVMGQAYAMGPRSTIVGGTREQHQSKRLRVYEKHVSFWSNFN